MTRYCTMTSIVPTHKICLQSFKDEDAAVPNEARWSEQKWSVKKCNSNDNGRPGAQNQQMDLRTKARFGGMAERRE